MGKRRLSMRSEAEVGHPRSPMAAREAPEDLSQSLLCQGSDLQLCRVTCQVWKRALWVQNVTLAQENHRDVRDQLQEARLAQECASGALTCDVCRERW